MWSREQIKTAKDAFLKYPTKSNREIAKITNLNKTTISKLRLQYDGQIDQEFIAITAGKFINEFGKAIDYWKLQIDELEKLKESTQEILLPNQETVQMPLSPMEKLAICKQQAELRKMIIYLGSQGEVREVIKVMRSGKLPMLEPVE